MQTHCQIDQFSIIYKDEYLVAIHKPAGLLVHRSPIDKHETQFAVQITRDAIGQKVYPLHRLDKPTSGLLLFALDSDTARLMGEQFMNHSIQKTYHAICRGWTDESGHIDHALKYKRDKIADKHKKDNDTPQEAITDYRRIATTTVDHTIGKFDQQRYSYIELSPKTGRKHQIRRHLNHINHPIIGDVKYGDRHHNHFFYDRLERHRLYLAATKLKFKHPITETETLIEAPLEKSFTQALENLKLNP